MARSIIFSMLLLTMASTAWANKNTGARDVVSAQNEAVLEHASERSVDQLQKVSALRSTLQARAGGSYAGVSEEDVGDADSFGRDKIYLGVNQTQPVYIDTDCSSYGPDDICYELDPVTRFVSVDEFDLGSITLPKKSSNSLLCFTFTQFSTWFWNNPTGSYVTGDMSLSTTVQIESEFLDGLVDSNGVPFNGQLWPDPVPIVVAHHQDTLPSGFVELERERVTRSCTGGLVSIRSLVGRGLTQEQAEDFFKDEDITITFGTQGTARHTDIAIFFAGIRIYGDD